MRSLSFAEAATTHDLPEQYHLDGIHIFKVPVIRQLSYLRGFNIEVQEGGTLESIRFCEANGMPIANLSAKALGIVGNSIQFEQDIYGRGCLPNMSVATAYILQLVGKGTVKITYKGRQLPSPTGPDGNPQPQIPPSIGLVNCYNEFYHPFTGGMGDRVQPMYRVGNWIKKLWVIFKDMDGKPLELIHHVLQWDDKLIPPGPLTYYPNGKDPRTISVNYDKLDTGLYLWKFPTGLHTHQSSYFGPRWYSEKDGTVSFIIQDEIRPGMIDRSASRLEHVRTSGPLRRCFK